MASDSHYSFQPHLAEFYPFVALPPVFIWMILTFWCTFRIIFAHILWTPAAWQHHRGSNRFLAAADAYKHNFYQAAGVAGQLFWPHVTNFAMQDLICLVSPVSDARWWGRHFLSPRQAGLSTWRTLLALAKNVLFRSGDFAAISKYRAPG